MRLFDWALDRDGAYRECRQCGRTVDSSTSTCPSCGSTDIAVYDF
jgi:RNA polymerase subunit RPABC4/transcription elongation factor Spt4